MKFYRIFTCRKAFVVLVFNWMVSWTLYQTLVSGAIDLICPPPMRTFLITIRNALDIDLQVDCIGWPQVRFHDGRVIQESIPNHFSWNIDYGRDILQERLSCEVNYLQRNWNCLRMFVIPNMCVWENPQLAMAGSGIPSQEGCPLCDVVNHEGDLICDWSVDVSGIHLLRWDIQTAAHVRDRKAAWQGRSSLTHELVSGQFFHLSFVNYFDDPVTLHCGQNGQFHLRGYRVALGAMMWERVVTVMVGGNSRWMCDVVVEMSAGLRWRRAGVVLWDSPVGYRWQDAARQPPCIDCAWSMIDGGLWVDRRGCNDDEAQWQRRYSFPRPHH